MLTSKRKIWDNILAHDPLPHSMLFRPEPRWVCLVTAAENISLAAQISIALLALVMPV